MKDLEYSMVDVSLAVLSYSKGRWAPEEILEFAFALQAFHEEETGESGESKPTLVSIKGGAIQHAEQEQESGTETE